MSNDVLVVRETRTVSVSAAGAEVAVAAPGPQGASGGGTADLWTGGHPAGFDFDGTPTAYHKWPAYPLGAGDINISDGQLLLIPLPCFAPEGVTIENLSIGISIPSETMTWDAAVYERTPTGWTLVDTLIAGAPANSDYAALAAPYVLGPGMVWLGVLFHGSANDASVSSLVPYWMAAGPDGGYGSCPSWDGVTALPAALAPTNSNAAYIAIRAYRGIYD